MYLHENHFFFNVICSFPLDFPSISLSAAKKPGSGSEKNTFLFAVCKVKFHDIMSALIAINSVLIISCYSVNLNKFVRKCVYTLFNFSMCFEVTLAM